MLDSLTTDIKTSKGKASSAILMQWENKSFQSTVKSFGCMYEYSLKLHIWEKGKEYSYMEVATTQSGPENAWVQLAQMGKDT